MPQGCEVYSPTGKLVFSTPDRLFQIAGNTVLPDAASSGSIVSDLFTKGTPFWYLKADYWYRAKWKLNVSIVGDTLSWSTTAGTFIEATPGRIYGILVYGVR